MTVRRALLPTRKRHVEERRRPWSEHETESGHLPGSEGEHVLQEQLGTSQRAKQFYDNQVVDYLTPVMTEFIGRMEMAFIATSDPDGECDCSFRAGAPGFIRVIDDKTIAYPELRGNGVMASMGNMLQNPHIGLFFVDFSRDLIGLHVNGDASIVPPAHMLEFHIEIDEAENAGKKPVQWVLIHVTEAYIHCSKHIPLLVPQSRVRHWGTDNPRHKGGDYFGVTAIKAEAGLIEPRRRRAAAAVNGTAAHPSDSLEVPVAKSNGSAPVPAVNGSVPPPAVNGSVPVPAVNGSVPVPAVNGSVPVPAVNGSVPVPAVKGSAGHLGVEAPVPVVNGSAGVPAVEAPVPAVNGSVECLAANGSAAIPVIGSAPHLVINGSAAIPTVNDSARVPVVNGSVPVPVVNGSAVIPVVNGSAPVVKGPAPVVNGSAPGRGLHGSASYLVLDVSALVPVASGSARVPAVNGSGSVPVVNGSGPAPAVKAPAFLSAPPPAGSGSLPQADRAEQHSGIHHSIPPTVASRAASLPVANGCAFLSAPPDDSPPRARADGSASCAPGDGSAPLHAVNGPDPMPSAKVTVPHASRSALRPQCNGSASRPNANRSTSPPTANGSAVPH